MQGTLLQCDKPYAFGHKCKWHFWIEIEDQAEFRIRMEVVKYQVEYGEIMEEVEHSKKSLHTIVGVKNA